MRRKTLGKIVSVVIVLCLLFSQTAFAETGTNVNANDIEYLKSVMDMIQGQYNGEVTREQLIQSALKGMFSGMDDYTVYFNNEEAKQFLTQVDGAYEGIGAMVRKVGEYTVVVKVFENSPAEKGGIIPGDRIVSVDGKNANGLPLEQVTKMLLGEADTKVSVGIVKNGETAVKSVDITRAPIKVNPVTYSIRNGIGYIKLEVFNSNTDEYLTKALNEMDKNNITKIALDLRDNPGGELQQALEVCKKFIPAGLITKLDYKSDEFKDESYYSDLKQQKYKIVLLVNGMSASASEIVAGAVQDTNAGTLIGTKTYGKAKVQHLVPMLTPEAYKKYEDALGVKVINAYDIINKYKKMPLKSEIIGYSKITVGEYTTPKGRMIDKIGLTPDIAVEDYAPANNIDINSVEKLTKTIKPSVGTEGIDVYNAEKILKAAGYDVDIPDMSLDNKTSWAIGKFQSDNGLFPCGVLDFTTQQTLNDKLDKLITEIDKQYVKAVEILNK